MKIKLSEELNLALAVAIVVVAVSIWPKAEVQSAESRGAYNTWQMQTGLVQLGASDAAVATYTNSTAFLPVEVHRGSGMSFALDFNTDAGTNGSVIATNGALLVRLLISQVTGYAGTNAGNFHLLTTNALMVANGGILPAPGAAFSAAGAWTPRFEAFSNVVQRFWFNLSPNVLDNAKWVKVMDYRWAATNTIWVSNLTASCYFPP